MGLVLGVGARPCATAEQTENLLRAILAELALSRDAIAAVATLDRRAEDIAVTSLGFPVQGFSAAELSTVTVPTSSATTIKYIGTGSVAEAAALLAAGPGASLVVSKRSASEATMALAQRADPAPL